MHSNIATFFQQAINKSRTMRNSMNPYFSVYFIFRLLSSRVLRSVGAGRKCEGNQMVAVCQEGSHFATSPAFHAQHERTTRELAVLLAASPSVGFLRF